MPYTIAKLGLLALVLSGCTSPEYRAAVSKFGESASELASNQAGRMTSLNDRQLADIRRTLVEQRVRLDLDPNCTSLIVSNVPNAKCTVIRTDGETIPKPEQFTTLEALSGALGNYGKSLGLLASDVSDDASAFNKSLLTLASSLGTLDSALSGQASTEAQTKKRNAAANLIGGLGNSLFAAERVATLKQIIIAADQDVQDAVLILSQASTMLSLSESTALFEEADRAKKKLLTLFETNGSEELIAKEQAMLFDVADKLNRNAASSDGFTEIGKTHAQLKVMAESGATPDDLESLIRNIIDLSTLVDANKVNF